MAQIIEIEGIGPVSARKLAGAGVTTTGRLGELAATTTGRNDLASQAEVTTTQALEWVNEADLMRIDGVGSEYSDLLEATGVDTVAELSRRNGENLLAAMFDVDTAERLVRRVPTPHDVKNWIAQAGALPRVVRY